MQSTRIIPYGFITKVLKERKIKNENSSMAGGPDPISTFIEELNSRIPPLIERCMCDNCVFDRKHFDIRKLAKNSDFLRDNNLLPEDIREACFNAMATAPNQPLPSEPLPSQPLPVIKPIIEPFTFFDINSLLLSWVKECFLNFLGLFF